MTKKKVLIIYSGARVWGGIETYLENLFKFYDRKKLELILVSLGEWALTEKLEKRKDQVISLSGQRIRFKTIEELVKLAHVEKAALIVSQGVVANAYARLAAKKCGIPHLVTVHSDINYDYPDQVRKILYKISDKQLRKVTKKYITVSKYLKAELMESGVGANKISVIYNGVDATPFKDEGRKPKAKNLTTIGSIGRFHYTKGYHNLITAFAYIKDLPVKLVIYGDGDERQELEELVKQLGLSGQVSLPGYIEEIGVALEGIDLYIQPSLMEGFGLTVVEAMLAKKPVIVTPAGSLPELVTDGQTGLITGDTRPESIAVTLKALIENKALAQKLAEAGEIEAKKRFSVTTWIAETEKIYLETAR